MTKNTSSGKTPEKITELLREAVAKKGQSAVARESGIALYSVQRYLKGIGEPTTKTLKRLADYFEISVFELRGDETVIDDMYTKSFIPVSMYMCLIDLFETHIDRLLTVESASKNKDYVSAVVDMAVVISEWYREFAYPGDKKIKEKSDTILKKFYDPKWTGEESASIAPDEGYEVDDTGIYRPKISKKDAKQEQPQPVKESGRDHKQQRKASNKKAKP